MRFPARTLVLLGLSLAFTACASMGPPLPPSLDLPKPPTDLRAVRRGDRVTLTWTVPTATTDRQTIHTVGTTQICRTSGAGLKECGTPVGQASPAARPGGLKASEQKVTASYSDAFPAALESDSTAAFLTYGVEVLNRDGRGAGLSNTVRVPLVRTLPPPQDFQARVTSRGVVLSWSGQTSPQIPAVTFMYRVFRRGEDQQLRLVGELPVGAEQHLTLTDSAIEWEKTYYYRAEVVTVIADAKKRRVQVQGDDTPEDKVFADDVFPPAVPSGVQAVFSGPGQKPFIDLVWAPVTDLDLAGYNVYRHTEGTAVIKLKSEVVKTPAYRDTSVEPGRQYFYSVTSVDARGNESARSEETSERVPR